MASIAKKYISHGGKLYKPGQEVENLSTAEWKQLMAEEAIENEYDPTDVVEAELLNAPDIEDDEDDSEGTPEPDDENADSTNEEAELDASEMPDVTGESSIVEPASAPRNRGGNKGVNRNAN